MTRRTRFGDSAAATLRLREGEGAPPGGWSAEPRDRAHTRLSGSFALPLDAAGFTLVEMLVAMAITLVMMAAVVTLFANVSNSVRNRRATIEMSGQLRHLRNVLQQDLQGATCPGLTWQRPESNHGYIELIEGQYREGYASNLIDNQPVTPTNPEIDHTTSILPSSNLPFADPSWATDGAGLGDYDDILMLTVRNEHEPFVGRSPTNVADDTTNDGDPEGFAGWNYESIESTLAEVVWFSIENPEEDSDANNFFGEPGMRTIYRRTLLIAPWLSPYGSPESDQDRDGVVSIDGATVKVVPGLLRVLPRTIERTELAEALAALVAFQDRYDLSVRLEWDHNIDPTNPGRWKIVANTLGDLTKRENRFGHYGYWPSDPARRFYPYPLVSIGSGYSGSSQNVAFVEDPEIEQFTSKPVDDAEAIANIVNGSVVSYTFPDQNNYTDTNRSYAARPFVFVDDEPSGVPATANAMLNDDGQVVRVLHGPVPLWGPRRGEDVMMTDVLAFDLRVFDPGAPLFGMWEDPTATNPELGLVLEPSDPGWTAAYAFGPDHDSGNNIGDDDTTFPFVGQGAYVDMGYGFSWQLPTPAMLNAPTFSPNAASATYPWFFFPRALSDVFENQLAPGYAIYDTWSFHYENNGVNEDADTTASGAALIDEGTDGLDGVGHYKNPTPPPAIVNDTRLGVDDVGERETAPPYDKPLRGMQVLIRTYERDSRAIRQVRVNQHFMPE